MAAIYINKTCLLLSPGGNGAGGPILSPNSTAIAQTNYSLRYTLPNGDEYEAFGFYAASGVAPSIQLNIEVKYLGNTANASAPSQQDVVSVDLVQLFKYFGDAGGHYSYSATLTQNNRAPGSTVTSELSFGGQGLGQLGPFTGTGSTTLNTGKTLTFAMGPNLTLSSDFNFVFTIGAGSLPQTPTALLAGNAAVSNEVF